MASNVDRFPAVVEIVVEIPRGSRNKYEFDETARVFTSPRDKRTQDYVTGRFG